MKVLHIQKVSGIGGAERHLLTLLPALAQKAVDPVLCVLDAPGAEPFKAMVRDAGIPLVTLPAGPDLNPSLVFRLRAEIRSQAPDLVHTHLIHADAYGQLAARTAGVPSVLSLHSAIFQYWSRPVRLLLAFAARTARGVLSISRYVAASAARVGVTPPSGSRVVHYGIDSDGWRFTGSERARARALYGWGEETLVIGVASRMIPLKGHDLLLDAYAKALPRLGASLVALAGDGPTRAHLESRAAETLPPDTASFLGYVNDVRSFINACDVLVFPTRPGLGEGFGLAALEAMAAARPTVATDVDALPELIEDGVSGLLVDPNGPDALAESLVRLASDVTLRERLGEGARARAMSSFGSERMAEETLDFYQYALSSAAQ